MSAAAAKPQTLDELMLAMDVVDTIRHRELLVERELSQGTRDLALRDRLRDIYKSQGIEVTNGTIDEGIKALKESRFAYAPPLPSLGRSLALAWVNRRRVAAWAVAILVAVPLFLAAYQWRIEQNRLAVVQVALRVQETAAAAKNAQLEREQLPGRLLQMLAETHARAASIAIEGRAKSITARLYREGLDALARGDISRTQANLEALDKHAALTAQSYAVRVVSRSGIPLTVYRKPYRGRSLRNHYLIVEAIGEDGRPLAVPITSEDRKTREVTTWGIRVTKSQYENIRADKDADGIVDKALVGIKRRGYLNVEYNMPVSRQFITKW